MTKKQLEQARVIINKLREQYPWKESYELSAVVCADLGIDEMTDSETFRLIDAMCAGYEDLSFITDNKSSSDAMLIISPDSPGSKKLSDDAPDETEHMQRNAPPQPEPTNERYGAYDPSYSLKARISRSRVASEGYFKNKESAEAQQRYEQAEQERLEQIAYNASIIRNENLPVGQLGRVQNTQRRAARSDRIARAEAEAKARQTELLARARETISGNIKTEVNRTGYALLAYMIIGFVISVLICAYSVFIKGWTIDELYSFIVAPKSMALFQGAILLLGLGVPFLVRLLRSGVSLGEILPLRRLRHGELSPMVWLGMGALVLQGLASNYVNYPAEIRGAFYDFEAVSFGSTVDELILTFVFLCIIPAFIECFVFNGVILQTLRRKGGDGFALVLSAILYALVTSNFLDYTGSILSTLVLGYLVIFSGSLVPALVVRFTERLFFFGITYLGFYSSGAEWVQYLDCALSFICLLGAIAAIHVMLGRFPDFFMLKKSDPCLTLVEKLKISFKSIPLILMLASSVLFAAVQFFDIDSILGFVEGLLYA